MKAFKPSAIPPQLSCPQFKLSYVYLGLSGLWTHTTSGDITTYPITMQASSSARPFVYIFAALTSVYGLWLLAFWPGALGEDSIAVLLEVQTAGEFQSGKPAFWYYFVKALFGSTGKVEVPIICQILLATLVFARILAWYLEQGHSKTFLFLLLFVCLAPHMLFYVGLLYADGPFAVAATGLLFELWQACSKGRLSRGSLLMIGLTLPFAALARSNGVVYLISVAIAAYVLKGPSRKALITLGLACLVAGGVGEWIHKGRSHGVLYPLALYETANFLQPRPMGLSPLTSRVSDETLRMLERYGPLQKIIDYYDPDYWDPLVYRPGGPAMFRLSPEDRQTLVREFFRFNLWHNLPAFISSRVNIFLVSALAQGGVGSAQYSEHVLTRFKSHSEYRPFRLKVLERFFDGLDRISILLRWLLWTPFVGLWLLWRLTALGLRKRQLPVLLIAIPSAIQAVAIFTCSTAGEYRYLLPFVTLPLAALPALQWEHGSRTPRSDEASH